MTPDTTDEPQQGVFSIIPCLEPFIDSTARFLVAFGGRASGKSWSIARILLQRALTSRIRVLCVRQRQNSIADSVHRLLEEQIELLGLSEFFLVGAQSIVCTLTGSEFFYSGLEADINRVRSFEGIDIVWAEEAQSVTAKSWSVLIPTIRKPGSQIYVSYNPDDVTDPTHRMFVVKPHPRALVIKANYLDNPHVTEEIIAEADHCAQVDDDTYRHVWLGECRVVSDAQVLRGKYVVEAFDDGLAQKYGARVLLGADWGFSSDPTTLVRCFMVADTLYVSHEAYRLRADLDRLQDVFDPVPDARRCRIFADNSQPGVVGLAQKRGFDVLPAPKWNGSIADGVAFLRQLKKIVIHPRCTHVIEETRLWAYKVDPRTNEPLPELRSGWDHCWDAIRYALTGAGLISKDDAGSRAVRQLERIGAFDFPDGQLDARVAREPAVDDPTPAALAQRAERQAAADTEHLAWLAANGLTLDDAMVIEPPSESERIAAAVAARTAADAARDAQWETKRAAREAAAAKDLAEASEVFGLADRENYFLQLLPGETIVRFRRGATMREVSPQLAAAVRRHHGAILAVLRAREPWQPTR
jgi:phage terminase large subunit